MCRHVSYPLAYSSAIQYIHTKLYVSEILSLNPFTFCISKPNGHAIVPCDAIIIAGTASESEPTPTTMLYVTNNTYNPRFCKQFDFDTCSFRPRHLSERERESQNKGVKIRQNVLTGIESGESFSKPEMQKDPTACPACSTCCQYTVSSPNEAA